MRITILGSGTSTGVPVIGCECATCRSTAPENQRLRASIFAEHGGGTILVDCSTDFRQQALRHRMARIDAVLMTHDHADHINGIDDLRSYNFLQDGAIDVYASAAVADTFRRRFDYVFNPGQVGGGLTRIRLREIEPARPFRLNGLDVLPVPVKHGDLDIFSYRLGRDFAYLTDCSHVPDSSVALLRGVRVLVVDALRPEPHSTHFSLDEALAFSRRVAPEQTWFTHMACKLEHFATNAALPPTVQLLHDGQILDVDEAPLP